MTVIHTDPDASASLRGEDHGATVSLILDRSQPGEGPRLHRHPYDETWVVHEGQLTFQIDDERLRAGPGDIVIVPAGAAHKFVNDGPGRSRMTCIHASPRMITEWLE